MKLITGKRISRYDHIYREDKCENKPSLKKKKKKKKGLRNRVKSEVNVEEEENTNDSQNDIQPTPVMDYQEDNVLSGLEQKELKIAQEECKLPYKEETPPLESTSEVESVEEGIKKLVLDIINKLPYPKQIHKKHKKKKAVKKPVIKKPIIKIHDQLSTSDELDTASIEKEHYLNIANTYTGTYSNIEQNIISTCKIIINYNKIQKVHWLSIRDDIELLIRKYFNKNCGVVIYGSATIGLALEESDLDLGIVDHGILDRENVSKAIEKLEMFFSNEKYIHSVSTILTARIPVLKAVVNHLGKKCKTDITFNMNENQVKNALKAAELSLYLMKKHKYLKEIVLFLKEKLAEQQLNIPYKGKCNNEW